MTEILFARKDELDAFTSSGGFVRSDISQSLSPGAKAQVYANIGLPPFVSAPAGTLTGTTLAANVLISSLTTVGTLTGGATGAGFTLNLATSTISGAMSMSHVSGTLPAAQMPALTGDITTVVGTVATSLNTVNSNIGSFGSASAVPNFTVNAKGLITAAGSTAVVAPAGTLSGATLAAGVLASSLTSVGTLTGGATGAGFTIALTTSTVTGRLANANLAQGAAVTLKGNPTNALANEQDFTISGLTALVAPDATDDYLLIWDHTAGTFKKINAGTIAAVATAGVASLGGATGALSLSSGLSVVGTTLTSVWDLSGSDVSYSGGKVGIGTASPSTTLEISAASNPKFSVSDPGVAHGMTDFAATSTFFLLEEITDNDGGARLAGFSDSAGLTPLRIIGAFGSTDPTDTVPGIWLIAGKRSGTSITDLSSTETVLQVSGAGSATHYLTILGGGNVGIGTATPTVPLEVQSIIGQVYLTSTTGTNYVRYEAINGSNVLQLGVESSVAGTVTTGSLAYAGIISSQNAYPLQLAAANAVVVTIATSGKVGIGSTTPLAPLEIRSASSAYTSNLGNLLISNSADASKRLAMGYDTALGAGWIQAVQDGVSTNPLILQPNGSTVGIGITAPTSTLDVRAIIAQVNLQSTTGTNYARYLAANSTNTLQLAVESSAGGTITTGSIAYAGVISSQNSYPLQLAAANSVALTILANGKVGIGTTTPSVLLDIAGITQASGQIVLVNATQQYSLYATGNTADVGLVLKNTASGGREWLVASSATASGLGAGFHIYDATAALDKLYIDATGNTYLINMHAKNGRPWADVKAWGAVGDGVTDDTLSIQAAIVYMTTAGGIVFFPPGSYKITDTLEIPHSVYLKGSSIGAVAIQTALDIIMINFIPRVGDFFGGGFGMESIFVQGVQDASMTQNLVVVGGPVILKDCFIWGGNFALEMNGSDGYVENCFPMGWGTNGGDLYSTGANWYIRCKFDDVGQAAGYAYYQDSSLISVAENHFTQCDFSGTFDFAVLINDGTLHTSITSFTDCVFSRPIQMSSAKWTSFVSCEIGTDINLNSTHGGVITVANSYGFTGIVVAGGIPNVTSFLSNNYNIT